jgi:membrane-associated phospholipid phosphatase
MTNTTHFLPFEQTLASDQLVATRSYFVLIALWVIAFVLLQAFDLNQSLFFAINEVSQRLIPDALAAHLTELGNGSIVGMLALMLTVKYPGIAKRFLIITLMAGIFIAGFKQFFADPRPAGVLAQTDFHIIGDVLKKYSFPSGHTTTAFAMAGFIMLTFQSSAVRWGVFLLAVIAGVSRISVGAHWPEDILAGAALGMILAYLGSLLSLRPFALWGSYCAAAFLALAALIGNLTTPADFPEIETIAQVRFLCASLAVVALVYYSVRLFQLFQLRKSLK